MKSSWLELFFYYISQNEMLQHTNHAREKKASTTSNILTTIKHSFDWHIYLFHVNFKKINKYVFLDESENM